MGNNRTKQLKQTLFEFQEFIDGVKHLIKEDENNEVDKVRSKFLSTLQKKVTEQLSEQALLIWHRLVDVNKVVYEDAVFDAFDQPIDVEWVTNDDLIKIITRIIQDDIFYYSAVQPTEENLQKKKLLEARYSSLEFEEKLAEILCGDNKKFPYKSSYYITQLFQETGLNYQHDGKTRRFWIRDVLLELSIKEIYFLIQTVFKQKYFLKHAKEKKLSYAQVVSEAREEFSQFLDYCLHAEQIIDLSPAFNLNIQVQLLTNSTIKTDDASLNKLIEKAIAYFSEGKKQDAIEKLWDAFERLKTYFDSDKKRGANKLIDLLSDELDLGIFDSEFKLLTQIGNSYMIRHSEKGKRSIKYSKNQDYLFFRMLSLVNLSLQNIKLKKEK